MPCVDPMIEELVRSTKRPQCHEDEHGPFIQSIVDVFDRDVPGCFVEIGVNKCRSAKCAWQVMRALGNRRKYYGIDPTGGPATYWDDSVNGQAQGLDVELIQRWSQAGDTLKLVDDPIAWLFVDGCHCYECALLDFDRWIPKLAPGGVIVIHDFDRAANYDKRDVCYRLTAEVEERRPDHRSPKFELNRRWGVRPAFENSRSKEQLEKLPFINQHQGKTPGLAAFRKSER